MRLMKHFRRVCLLIFTLSASLFAQDAGEWQKIKSAIENREYAAAIAGLQNFEQKDAKLFAANNFDYLLARVAEKTGDNALAAAQFQAAANRDSVLKEYALRHLAEIARSSGNLLLERIFLQEIQATTPESLLNDATNARLARNYFESGNFANAIKILNAAPVGFAAQSNDAANDRGQKPKDDRLNRENQVFLGESFLQANQPDRAREIFNQLITTLPNPSQPDDFALAAVRNLDALDNFGAANAIGLSETEHRRRAQIYQFNRNFAAARAHYETILKNSPAAQSLPDLFYQIGRTLAQEENFVAAIEWFERVHNEFPADALAPDALGQAAAAYARVGKPKEAAARYQKIIGSYPDYERLDRAYLNLIDLDRDGNRDTEALQWARKTQEFFRGKPPEAVALFAQARIHLSQRDWQAALADLEKLLTFSNLGGNQPGGTNETEITFLRGFALENLRRFPEAIDVYLSISDGRGEYYGGLATERLQFLTGDEAAQNFVSEKIGTELKNIEIRNAEAQRRAAQNVLRLKTDAATRTKMLEILRRSYATLPDYQKVPRFNLLEFGRKTIVRETAKNPATNYHQKIADELLFLNLYDEAAPELEASLTQKKDAKSLSGDENYTLAVFYNRGEMANRAVTFAEPLWRKIPADFQIELIPRDQAELLFPAPYADALLKYAPERRIDPRFALSIMRQESRYRADVKSVAAARGLMQFIPDTANRIAGELNRRNFDQNELYQPPVAILFGAQYLSDLFKIFPNQAAAVAASYNGGESNIKRWKNRANADAPEQYVPEIIFAQSKDYVYKVMANYRVYRFLYDENLRRN